MPKKPVPKEIVIQQAKRLKHIRAMLRIAREYIEKKYHISSATLKAWENGLTPITDKGLTRCIDMYRQEGLLLTREWILLGTGISPRISLDMGKYLASDLQYSRNNDTSTVRIAEDSDKFYASDETTAILREAAFFKESHPHSIVIAVTNDDMYPVYQIGDYVGGIFRHGKNIDTAVKLDCIVRLTSGELLLRRLFKGTDDKHNLACINPNPNSSNTPVIFDAKVECAAPIIWHRKPNP